MEVKKFYNLLSYHRYFIRFVIIRNLNPRNVHMIAKHLRENNIDFVNNDISKIHPELESHLIEERKKFLIQEGLSNIGQIIEKEYKPTTLTQKIGHWGLKLVNWFIRPIENSSYNLSNIIKSNWAKSLYNGLNKYIFNTENIENMGQAKIQKKIIDGINYNDSGVCKEKYNPKFNFDTAMNEIDQLISKYRVNPTHKDTKLNNKTKTEETFRKYNRIIETENPNTLKNGKSLVKITLYTGNVLLKSIQNLLSSRIIFELICYYTLILIIAVSMRGTCSIMTAVVLVVAALVLAVRVFLYLYTFKINII